LVAAVGFAILVVIGFEQISNIVWKLVLALFLVLDLAFGSAVGFPLPSEGYQPTVDMSSLKELPDGGIVHLPFFVQGHNLFDREHFQYQLAHNHPIGDPIMGFPPKTYLENQLLCQLLLKESTQFPLHMFPCGNQPLSASVGDLQEKGFVAIVLEREKYDSQTFEKIINQLDSFLPKKEERESLTIYFIQ